VTAMSTAPAPPMPTPSPLSEMFVSAARQHRRDQGLHQC
jgi:hypothetical protein